MKFVTNGGTPQIEKAASKNDTRPTLTRPYLLLDKPTKKGAPVTTGRVAACDSYILAVVPVEFNDQEKPVEGHIEPKVFVEGRKHEKRFNDPVQVLADKTLVLGSEATFPAVETPNGNSNGFPDVDRLMPDQESIADFHVGLNAKLLWQLSQALGQEQVLLEFVADGAGNPVNLRGIRVRPLSGKGNGAGALVDGPVGLMMPIRVAS